ncbi:MAG: hypothetical protein Q4F21_03185 [Lachnospiraceae bacterium]|nr:hypothetical protein [Lachnospiraceae bacterium]
MKRIKKVMAVLLLLVICASGMNFTSGAAQAVSKPTDKEASAKGVIHTEEFEIRIEYGLEGNYRAGAAVPVVIYMKSLKENFEGTIRIIAAGQPGTGVAPTAYEKDVMLTKDIEKAVTMSVHSNAEISALKFELENSSGGILFDKSVIMNNQNEHTALTGVLSDDYTALNYFDGITLAMRSYSGDSELVELNADSFPEQASGLEALSYLIINSFDTSKLSDLQYQAIKRWVEQGGVLILGTGSDYKQTLSAFQDDMIPGRAAFAGKGVMQLYSDKKDVLKFTKKQELIKFSFSEGKPLKGVLKQENLIWNREYGQGHVIVTAYNLGMEPVNSWVLKSQMAKGLLEKSASGYSDVRMGRLNYGESSDLWMMSQALDGLYEVGLPDTQMLILLFAAFVLIAGPGLYLFLKLFDKREWMWVLIPVLAVGITGGVFWITSDIRIREPLEAAVTTQYYDADFAGNNQEQVQMSICVPDTEKRLVTLDSVLTNIRFYNAGEYYSANMPQDKEQYDYRTSVRETTEGYQIGIQNKTTFDSTYLQMSRAVQMEEVCGLETDIVKKITGISGTITNNTGYELKQAFVFADNKVVELGSMKPGESRTFSEADNKIMSYGINMYDLTMPGIERNSREYYQVLHIMEMIQSQYLINLGVGQMDTYTCAYIDEWNANYVSMDSVKEQNKGVMIKHESLKYGDYADAQVVDLYDCPFDDTKDWTPDGQMCADSAEVVFHMTDEMNRVMALVCDREAGSAYGSAMNTSVYGWNTKTGQYDELFKDGKIMKFDKKCPYLDKNSCIKLKFTCNTPYEEYSPRIMVIGGMD